MYVQALLVFLCCAAFVVDATPCSSASDCRRGECCAHVTRVATRGKRADGAPGRNNQKTGECQKNPRRGESCMYRKVMNKKHTEGVEFSCPCAFSRRFTCVKNDNAKFVAPLGFEGKCLRRRKVATSAIKKNAQQVLSKVRATGRKYLNNLQKSPLRKNTKTFFKKVVKKAKSAFTDMFKRFRAGVKKPDVPRSEGNTQEKKPEQPESLENGSQETQQKKPAEQQQPLSKEQDNPTTEEIGDTEENEEQSEEEPKVEGGEANDARTDEEQDADSTETEQAQPADVDGAASAKSSSLSDTSGQQSSDQVSSEEKSSSKEKKHGKEKKSSEGKKSASKKDAGSSGKDGKGKKDAGGRKGKKGKE